jgi:SAM-dependent methyltransferase
MPPSSPEQHAPTRPPHPLALRLIDRLRGGRSERARVLDFACGSGRNAAALSRAGFDVTQVEDAVAERTAGAVPNAPFAAVISTHGFLHGTAAEIGERAGMVARALVPGGLFYACFGSTRDARFERGQRIDDRTFAPQEGDERGVPHAFFSRAQLAELLGGFYAVETMDECCVDEIAGTWAHPGAALSRAYHWMVVALKNTAE